MDGEWQRKRCGPPFLVTCATQSRDQEKPGEDYLLVAPRWLGAFDAIGGRDNGLLVSHLAGRTIAAYWQTLPETERQGVPAQIEEALQSAIRCADTAIARLVLPTEQRRPVTTLAPGALSLQQSQAYASVGQPLQCLTTDHGYFRFAVRRQLLSEAEAWRIEQVEQWEDLSQVDRAHFERRHQITCAVGWSDFPAARGSDCAMY
ncbi:MAG TPA: hypothetical protein VGF67_21330 [Ktedonobacteraceae bacterium]